ncbi:MAG TPA: serine/threonine-protein kinase [Enhygromyxa sp.]|nr:serine/threonine-protein kinase [Enhygromyxa sp.]
MDQEVQHRPREADTIADMDSDPGDARKLSTVGRYVVLDSVGMGGMGLVCAAYDPKLNRKIALKLLRNASNDEASTAGRNRLFREAQALAKLSHPNVVTVHDVDVFEGQVYIAMEFVEGTTLREWLRDESRSWKQILEKFILAGRGLAAAHQADIIHRDFKPSNVLISKEGDVRVADFGVAKERDRGAHSQRDYVDFERKRRTVAAGGSLDTTAEDALIEEIQSNVSLELTVAGRMVGTPAYMAPEQHMGLRVGPYTDQYSFCVSLYEALYGRLPFEGTDRRDQLSKMTEGRLPPPPTKGAARNVPSWLHKVVARGLRPHPSERWPSMNELLAALERDPVKRMRRWALAGVGVLGLATGIVLMNVTHQEPPTENRCLVLGDEVEQHWNAERRADIEAAFKRSTKPYAGDAARRVIATLDRWAGNWRSSKVAICEATDSGEQSEKLLDMRMYCLTQRAREVDAMVEVFAEADDEIVERSVSAAHALGDPEACRVVLETDEFKQRKLDPVMREEVEGMEADLDRARALASLHKYDESLPLQARVAAKARELSHPWTLMRAVFDLAKSQLETGDVAGGESGLREVIRLASSLGDVSLEADAWIQLIFYVAAEHNRIAEGEVWSFAAEMALLRIAGDRASLQVNYENALAYLALADGDVPGGIEHFGKALELARKAYGEEHPLTIRMLMNKAVALARAEKHKQAEKVLLEAVARSKEVYGPAHPVLATAYFNLGNVYVVSKRPSQAESALRSALSIYERIGGPNDRILAKPLHARGKVAREQGHYEDALADLERAAAIFIASNGENSSEAAAAFIDIGTTQHALRRFDDARQSYDRAQAIYNNIYPNGHRHVGGLMKRRCDMFVDAHLYADAVAACDLALENAERFGLDDMDIKKEIYELLVAAERGRGRAAAAERAQAKLDEIVAAIEAEDDEDEGEREEP